MDINSGFTSPSPVGFNDSFVPQNFEPIGLKKLNKVEPTILDGIKNKWNPVGEFVRDIGHGIPIVGKQLEQLGEFMQPQFVNRNGKLQETKNKTFNDLSKKELDNRLNDLTANNQEDADGMLYKLSNPRTGEVKYGTAGDGVWNRYKDDNQFQENWTVEYQRPMKDTAYAERLIHGNKGMIENQAYGVGQGKHASLVNAGTEIYKNDSLGQNSINATQRLLSPEQQSLGNTVWDKIKEKSNVVSDTVHAMNKSRLEGTADLALGAGIGINKLGGALNSLMGYDSGKKLAQTSSTNISNAMVDKESISAHTGEIVPEFMIPAVLKAPALVTGLAGRIAYGAGSGALINGGYEELKKQADIKEGLPQNTLFAAGAGGIIGGIVGGLTKNPTLGKEIGKAFEHGDDKAREAIIQQYPETHGALLEYAKNHGLEEGKVAEEVATTLKETKEKRKQEEVQPQKEVLRTKEGRKIYSKEVKTGNKEISNIEYNVVEPKEKVGKPLDNQTYVPEVNNPKKFKYGYDERGRVYTEESSMLSPQGGATQKATLEQKTKPEIENPHEEVARRLEFYDRDSKLRERYGQTQASYKEGKELTDSQRSANRLQFEKEQYKDLLKDDSLSKELKDSARARLSELNMTKIKDYIATEEELEKADKKFKDQFQVSNKDAKSIDEREKSISEDYKAYRQLDTNKADYKKVEFKSDSEITQSIIKRYSDSLADAKKEIAELKKKEKLEGREFKAESITKEQRKNYRDQVAKIEDIQNARHDLKLFKEKKINLEELQYREKRRLDDQISRENKQDFKNEEELNTYKQEVKQRYEDIGVTVKDSETKFKEQIQRTGNKETEKSKAKRETREKEEVRKSEVKHNDLVNTLGAYRKTKQIQRHKSGEMRGQSKLTEGQMEDVKRGILTNKEIANKKNPIGKDSEVEDLRTQAKESANKKVIEHTQKELGIEWKVEPKNIVFKDTLSDASNSIAQMFTVLLGSKNLAKITKLAGKDSLKNAKGEATDIREIVGETMENNGYKKPIVIKDGKELSWKDLVKPVFMTENYGQGEAGLIKDVMKAQKVDKQTATQFVKAYKQAFDKVAPEMVTLKNKIMEVFKNGNGEIKYTMPDGFKVEFTAKKKLDGTYSVKGKNTSFKIETNNVDDMSSAILPNIIHSVDAYVAREMNKLGIATVHDAFQTPKGWTDEMVQEAYGNIMAKVNKSNLLDQIMKSIGHEGDSLKVGDLSEDAIKESAKNKESLAEEEVKDSVEKAKEREIDVSKSTTPEDVMKEFMAKDNVRESGTSQLIKEMVNESGYRTMSVARDGDDVFERQIALAHQSAEYNKSMEIKAPDGVNKQVWDKVQRDIFNEARAKLEFNPLLNGVIQGERKYFTEAGKIIGEETKTFKELLQEEIKNGVELHNSLNAQKKETLKEIGKDYNQIQRRVKSWSSSRQLNHAEAEAKELVNNARQLIGKPSTFKRNIDKVKSYFKDQVSDSKVTKDFAQLLNFRKSREGFVGEKAEYLKKSLDKMFKGHDSKELTDSILKTDYHAIQELKTEKEALQFKKEQDNIYQIARKYIEQSAKAIGESSEQVGFFRNNAKAIAEELNLPLEVTPIIDKLISIEAMTPKAWETLSKIRDTEDFKYVMDIIENNKERSAKLFGSNPNQQVKGYVSEVYNSKYRIDRNKVRFDAENTDELGAIPRTMENKKVGSYQEEFPKGDFKNLQEKSEFAQKNRLKLTENGNFRRVADAELKDKAGRSNSFSEILSKTTASIDGKETQQLIAKNIIDEMANGNEMFSKEPKAGYRLIEDKDVSGMPKVVADSLAGRYVLEAYDKRLMGRQEVRLYSGASQVGKIADRMLKETTTMFKQNNVLKNINSYLNATMVNQLLGTMSGVNPAKLLKYQKEAIDEIKTTEKLKEEISVLEARGQDAKSLQAQLEKSLLYKLEKAGLAINKLEVAGDDSTLIGTILSKLTGGYLDRAANEILMTQKSFIGSKAFKVFGTIDTQGRYTIAKNALDNGKTIEEAVAEANGLFSDMGQMAPAFIELMDKYPFIPFMKWASLTMPRLMRLTKENQVKAFSLGITVYGLQMETNTNLSTVNPLESVVNFGDDATTLNYFNDVEKKGFGEATYKKIKTFYVPKVYRELKAELDNPDKHDFILKDRIRGEYQPLTQKLGD